MTCCLGREYLDIAETCNSNVQFCNYGVPRTRLPSRFPLLSACRFPLPLRGRGEAEYRVRCGVVWCVATTAELFLVTCISLRSRADGFPNRPSIFASCIPRCVCHVCRLPVSERVPVPVPGLLDCMPGGLFQRIVIAMYKYSGEIVVGGWSGVCFLLEICTAEWNRC
jgi:hypothetical protein